MHQRTSKLSLCAAVLLPITDFTRAFHFHSEGMKCFFLFFSHRFKKILEIGLKCRPWMNHELDLNILTGSASARKKNPSFFWKYLLWKYLRDVMWTLMLLTKTMSKRKKNTEFSLNTNTEQTVKGSRLSQHERRTNRFQIEARLLRWST